MKSILGVALFAFLAGAQDPARQPVRPEDKGSIEGGVFNATTGEGLKKAEVMLRRAGDNTPVGASTDPSGHFVAAGLDPGRYTLSASHNGFIAQSYGAKGADHAPKVLLLPAGGNLKDITFRLTQQGVIAGRILDEDGDPLPNVAIQCSRYVYNQGRKELAPAGGGNSNDLGEYRVFGLMPGKYYVSATYRNVGNAQFNQAAGAAYEQGYATTYFPNALVPASASALDVTPGAQLRGIDITLSKTRTVRVRGRVVDANNRPVQNAAVTLIAHDPANPGGAGLIGRRLSANMDGKGEFEIHGVVPGQYYLIADEFGENSRASGRVVIDVGSTNLDGAVVSVGPLPDLSGRIFLEGKANPNLPAVSVYLESKTSGGGISGGRTQPDGAFQLRGVATDAYLVNVFGLSGNVYLKAVRFGDADVTDSGVDFTQGVPQGEFTVTLSAAGGQVSGAVQDDKQQQSPGAQVVLVPEESKRGIGRLFRTVAANQNGNFVLRGIAPGDYKLFAWESVEPNAWQDPDFLKPFESKGETVTIKESSTETKQLKLIPAGETTPAQ